MAEQVSRELLEKSSWKNLKKVYEELFGEKWSGKKTDLIDALYVKLNPEPKEIVEDSPASVRIRRIRDAN